VCEMISFAPIRRARSVGQSLGLVVLLVITAERTPYVDAAAATTTIDRIDDVTGWSVNADGGDAISFRAETADCHSPPAAMRVSFKGRRWGNLGHAAGVPRDATAVTFWARVHETSSRSSMYVWLFEPDGDGHICQATVDGRGPAEWGGEWTRIRVPLGRFRYDPRGNRKRDLLSVDRILLGFNYAPMEVSVDDVAWELREGAGRMTLPRSESFNPAAGPSGRIALLDEPGLAGPHGHQTVKRLKETLGTRGFGVTSIRAGDLADPARLARSNFDLLVLTQGPRFPVEAKQNLLRYLQAGGSLLTSGGYAFDEPVVFAGDAWQPAGTVETAAELQAGRPPIARINTRFGRPGDAMGLDKLQIGMFDPSYPFERVVCAKIADRRIDGPLLGYVACITDPTGSPVFGTANLRFIPLGQTLDRLGQPRGPLGGVAHHFAGPYAGSSWAFFGVEDRDVFAEGGLPADFVAALARRLVDQVYLHGLTTDLACYREGEAVQISIQLANRGRNAAAGRLRLAVDEEVVYDQPVQVAPDRSRSERIEVVWRPGRFDRDFYHVRATLVLPSHTDVLENGFCAWDENVLRAGPKIALRDNYFCINDRPMFLTGTNQTGRMWLAEYETPLVWRDDFAGMRDHGLILWRILHFSAVMHRNDPLALRGEVPKKVVRQTDAIVQLAQKYGVVIFLTLHDWMPVELTDEQLAAQARWNAFWVERYKDVPGIIYDVQNEPSVRVGDAPHVTAEWKRMLTERYGDVAAAARRWGVPATDPSATRPRAAGKAWGDLKAADVERFRVHLLNRWVKGNVEPVRRADPDALITVGYLQRMRPADKVLGAEHVDFANMHSYLPPRAFPSDFKIMDRRAVGKTLTLGEFGQREAHDARVNGQTGDRPVASIQRYLAYNHDVLGLGGSFTASWCWRDMPDCIFPWGMTRPDHLAKPVVRAYRNFTLLSRFIKPKYQAPGVWLILPGAHRLGGRWADIDDAIDRTIDALLGLRVSYGVLREKDVVAGALVSPINRPKGSDAAPPVLIWPMPYCPDDATFEAVKKCVETGASLYLSGDVSFDDARKATRSDRLAALGLRLDAHSPPMKAKSSGEAQQTRVGRGRVFFVPHPVELAAPEALRKQVGAFLSYAEAPRIGIEPEDPDLHAFVTHTVDGGTIYSVVNHGRPRTVKLTAGTEPLSIDVAAPGYGLAALSAKGQLALLQTQGNVRRGGRFVVEADADVMVVALDGEDLARSARLLVMPNAVGTVRITTDRRWHRPVDVVGEIVEGRFKALESMTLVAGQQRLILKVDADKALCLIVIAEWADAGPATEQVRDTLTLGRR